VASGVGDSTTTVVFEDSTSNSIGPIIFPDFWLVCHRSGVFEDSTSNSIGPNFLGIVTGLKKFLRIPHPIVSDHHRSVDR